MAPDSHAVYQSPLVARNASPEMAALFSAHRRILTWRQLWITLAEAQRELGLNISARQIAQMKGAYARIDFKAAAAYEQALRHDVMAHVRTFGDAAPAARGIIHLGATSAFVVDNADLLIMRQAADLIRDWLVNVIDALGRFAEEHARRPTLGYTHFQPAQLTTVGKRAALWCHEFLLDLERLEFERARLQFRGTAGATGTQASFLELFGGSKTKVRQLDRLVAHKMGFDKTYPVVGQTYSRKVDALVVGVLAGIAASVHRMANDIRLLAGLKEMDEPIEPTQVGSSAMAYKRNPMRSERATALARFVMSLSSSPLHTAAEQWFERTLDDSANKRLTIPEAFLATDGMLVLMTSVARGLVVYPKVIESRIGAELPFMATENILMAAVQAGGDRQELHERIRRHARKAAERVKQQGGDNDLMSRLAGDPAFAAVDLQAALDPAGYVGLAAEQTRTFIRAQVQPIRRRHAGALRKKIPLKV